jgi:hypothetical protein
MESPMRKDGSYLGIASLLAAVAAFVLLVVDFAVLRFLYVNRFAREAYGIPSFIVQTLVHLPLLLSVAAGLMGVVSGLRLRKDRNVSRLGLFGIFVAGLVFMVHLASFGHGDSRNRMSNSWAINELEGIAIGAQNYRTSHWQFPGDLESLIREDLYRPSSLASEKFVITYTPGPPGDDGRIFSFSVHARPKEYGGRSFYSTWASFYLDQSHVLRYTVEDRPATAQDPELVW